MNESCANCKNCYNLYDWSNSSKMEGFVCMAFADDRVAIWMEGVPKDDIGPCEAWEPKEVSGND